MKNLLYISTLLVLLASCNDFLTIELKGEYSSDNFFTSATNAEMAVNGVYNSLYGNQLWIFGDVASDDAVKGGNAGDQADIISIDDFSANADNGILNTYWQTTYETISRANNCIAYIPDIDMDETVKNRLLGEAKFLRAYSYFNLSNIFGKVPLKLFPQNTMENINVGLSDLNIIYQQIENDLKDAIAACPIEYPSEKGRVTQGAALAFLAKVQLYQKKYAECLANIILLEDLNIYDLVTDYEDLFKAGAEDSIEVVFGLRFINNEEVNLGNNLNVWFSPAIEGGYAFNAPTQDYVDCFTEQTVGGDDDPRLDASIGRDGKPWFNGTTFSASWSEATGYLVKKYNEDKSEEIAKAYSTVPFHIIRYADVLLIKAEAAIELGGDDNLTLAATALNRVRARAKLAPATATTQAGLRDIVRAERRKELGFEFHRFFDQMRWKTESRFYFPIPQSEMDTNLALK